VFGLLSGIGLFLQFGLAQATSVVFGAATGAGAMLALLAEGSSGWLYLVIALVLVASALVINGAGWLGRVMGWLLGR
jgi:hypothetical protein